MDTVSLYKCIIIITIWEERSSPNTKLRMWSQNSEQLENVCYLLNVLNTLHGHILMLWSVCESLCIAKVTVQGSGTTGKCINWLVDVVLEEFSPQVEPDQMNRFWARAHPLSFLWRQAEVLLWTTRKALLGFRWTKAMRSRGCSEKGNWLRLKNIYVRIMIFLHSKATYYMRAVLGLYYSTSNPVNTNSSY